jgi:predicted O-linked N-acetylglucosamine transferase (SPINDLY family)
MCRVKVPVSNTHRALQNASQLHGQGHYEQAEKLYRQILSADRKNADALHLLGILLHQTGRTAEGVDFIRKAIKRDPHAAQFHLNLANVYGESNQPELAAESLRKAITLEPRAIEPRLRLARFLNGELNRPREAVDVLRDLVAIAPNHAQTLAEMGLASYRCGEASDALSYYEKAFRLNPNDSDLLCNYSTALVALGRYERAAELIRRGLELQPRHEKLWYNLGRAQVMQDRPEDAIAAFRRAKEINPHYTAAEFQLSLLLSAENQLEESVELFARSLPDDVERAKAFGEVARVRMLQGRLDEAIAMIRRAIQLDDTNEVGWQNLMMMLNYHPDDNTQQVFAEHRAWAARHEQRYPPRQHRNDRSSERRLRIGYVSADLRHHPITFFLSPILERHDREQFEVFCYANQDRSKNDAMTAQLQSYGHQWREIYELSDDSAAALIEQDGIDLLIDLASHTAGNRLLMFARKPAPVQGAYLAYAGTTGLAAMDFRLTDPWLDPPGVSEAHHVERLVRLSSTQWVYRAPPQAAEISPLPAQTAGHITFGVATNLAKVNLPTIEFWSRVLQAVPDSILILKAVGLTYPQPSAGIAEDPLFRHGGRRFWEVMREHYLHLFARCGIPADRVRLESSSALADYFRWFSQIDIALDTFPFAGGTTSCHALYMGVPVVTRTGNLSVSRVGSSILHNIGLGELVAQTPDQFERIAIELAHDRARLAEMRRTLRQRMQQSPLMDEPQFVRNLESAYRQLWREWCAERAT